jgi:hypothetical protein
MDLAPQLYLLDALAGVDVEAEAATVAKRLNRETTSKKTRPFALWLLGAWHARNHDRAATNRMRVELLTRSASSHDPWIARLAQVLAARLVLLQGDTVPAIDLLRAELGAGRREALDWDISEPLAADRLLLAELLLARGLAAEALATATVFDHQAPAVFLPFLPASLTLRRQAALALGRDRDARRLEGRLAALGQGGRIAHAASFNMEAP